MERSSEAKDVSTTLEIEALASLEGWPVSLKVTCSGAITRDTIQRAVDTVATELALAGAEPTGYAKLFFRDCQIVEDGHSPAGLLLVRFRDETGREVSWAPRWDDLHEPYDKAFTVEVIDTRETGKWKEIHRFLETTRRILSKGLEEARARTAGGKT
ncbi:MAG: hypothetical protein ACE5I2_15655 [Anaerolineae bacterium]